MLSERLEVRLDRADLAALDRVATAYGLSRSATIRALIRGATTPELTAAESPLPGPSLETLLAQFSDEYRPDFS